MNKDNEQTGGAPDDMSKYAIPEYKEPLNNPMIPNAQKKIYAENKAMEHSTTNPNQILNLQLYQPPKAKPTNSQGRPLPNPSVFYPNYVPNPFDPIGYANYMHHTSYNMQPAPVYKEYNINIGGIAGSHLSTAMLFEDILPVKNVSGSFASVGERITMYESVRANLFSSGDGKDVPIENDSYNLLSHIKLMDMNPYNMSRFSNNPYKGLPFGFLLYRSCYPMRHDTRNFGSVCAPNSTGVNVRIYRLTEGAYMVNKQNITNASDYDEWREMAYYNFVKEHIIKKKICPHFVIMYGYNVTLNSNIKFEEIRMIQNHGKNMKNMKTMKSGTIQPSTSLTTNNGTGLNVGKTTYARNYNNNYRNANLPSNQLIPIKKQFANMPSYQTTTMPTHQEQVIVLNKYTGKALVCLTEAPNYTLFGWAKKEYRADGNVKRMINSGYHTKAVWESVLFQLLVGMYVMQIKGIIIDNFRIDRNVFIKDISISGTVTNYWKYKIEGIEYYVPNYGYVVLIDSNYRDYDNDTDCDDISAIDPKRVRKLDGAFINGNNPSLTKDQYMEKTFEMFRLAIDHNLFNQDFVNDNGIKPPEDIIRLMTNIRNMADSKQTYNIADYIRKFMTMFLNNRVGGPLTDGEIHNVKDGAIKNFRAGQIAVMTNNVGVHTFVIIVEKKKENDEYLIITKDKLDQNKSNIIEKEVPSSSLSEYSIVETIRQNFKINESNLNEESLLETYNVE